MVTHPARFAADHLGEGRSRELAAAGAFFFMKAILLLPHVVALLFVGIAAAVTAWVGYFAIVFTGSMPESWLRLIAGSIDWQLRTSAWMFGLVDEYPPFGFEAVYPARFTCETGGPERRRSLAALGILFLKWVLALPHLIVLGVLGYVVGFAVWVGYVMVLVTGRFPLGLHEFLTGFLNWTARAAAWTVSLTDEYPPFEWDSGFEPVAGV